MSGWLFWVAIVVGYMIFAFGLAWLMGSICAVGNGDL